MQRVTAIQISEKSSRKFLKNEAALDVFNNLWKQLPGFLLSLSTIFGHFVWGIQEGHNTMCQILEAYIQQHRSYCGLKNFEIIENFWNMY